MSSPNRPDDPGEQEFAPDASWMMSVLYPLAGTQLIHGIIVLLDPLLPIGTRLFRLAARMAVPVALIWVLRSLQARSTDGVMMGSAGVRPRSAKAGAIVPWQDVVALQERNNRVELLDESGRSVASVTEGLRNWQDAFALLLAHAGHALPAVALPQRFVTVASREGPLVLSWLAGALLCLIDVPLGLLAGGLLTAFVLRGRRRVKQMVFVEPGRILVRTNGKTRRVSAKDVLDVKIAAGFALSGSLMAVELKLAKTVPVVIAKGDFEIMKLVAAIKSARAEDSGGSIRAALVAS